MSVELNEKNLTVAMITMNEEKAVEKVIRDIQNIVPHAGILVVDSSSDKTPEIAEKLGAEVIRQYPPKGYGPAMGTALRSAKGKLVVTLDCDDTYPVDQIPVIARLALEEHYDLVDASRLKSKPKAMPWINYFANAGFALMASLLFGKWITDLHSGMRAYRTSLFSEMDFDDHGAALPVELLLRPIKEGKRIKVHFIEYDERVGDSTMKPLQSAWWTLKRILRVRFF